MLNKVFKRIKYHKLYIIFFAIFFNSLPSYSKNLNKKSFKEILNSYLFINDFSTKEEDRPISSHLFWKYPLKIPPIKFKIEYNVDTFDGEFPATEGAGLPYQHINSGRIAFLKGDYKKAKKIWLSCKARYGKTYKHYRRNDYFIGLAFLNLARKSENNAKTASNTSRTKSLYGNAATFLSAAFIYDEDQDDPLLDLVAPKQLYNLAAIYYKYQRYSGAYGAADRGLNNLRKTGRKIFRSRLRRILAETHIKNRSYLDAAKEFDLALRLKPSPKQASAIFARMADIYYDLNNYEIAEDLYNIANTVDEKADQITPAQFVLRGESLFWLKKFSRAQAMFHYALETTGYKNISSPLPKEFEEFAALRNADAYLARNKINKARLEYFKVRHNYPGTQAAKIAIIRESCLELPYYKGNNITHARKMLEKLKTSGLDKKAIELAWSCKVASYTQRERTNDMVNRVRKFYEKYPNSKFLSSLVTPVKEVEASKLKKYFNNHKPYSAVSYFENTRDLLYKKLSVNLKINLFTAYMDMYKPEKAKEFWHAFNNNQNNTDLNLLRKITFLLEIMDDSSGKKWQKNIDFYSHKLSSHKWTISANPLSISYIYRILATKKVNSNLFWIYKLARHWNKKDNSYLCNMMYPILSQMNLTNGKMSFKKFIQDEVTAIIKENLPGMLQVDETCSISLLNLELKIFDPETLANRYIDRQNWPLSNTLTNLFWVAAQKANTAKKPWLAKKIWKIILNNAPKTAPEKIYAKVMLNSNKSNLDILYH